MAFAGSKPRAARNPRSSLHCWKDDGDWQGFAQPQRRSIPPLIGQWANSNSARPTRLYIGAASNWSRSLTPRPAPVVTGSRVLQRSVSTVTDLEAGMLSRLHRPTVEHWDEPRRERLASQGRPDDLAAFRVQLRLPRSDRHRTQESCRGSETGEPWRKEGRKSLCKVRC